MAARTTHNLAVKIGEYTDEDGQTRGNWLRLGRLVQHDDGGQSIKLDFFPVGLPDWSGWISVFPREYSSRNTQGGPRTQGRQRASPAAPAGGDDFDDDIPF